MSDKPFFGATRSISIFILILLTLISCDIAIQEPRLGSLVVSADETITRTITPDLQSLHISAYKVIGIGSDSERFEKQADTLPIHIPDLKEGSWAITVEGYNSNNQKIAEKTRTVRITAGETTSETFILSWVSGFGSFQIQISWPQSITDVASIRATLSQNDVVIEQTILDKMMANEVGDRFVIGHSLAVLPTGSYDYALTFLDDSDRILGLQYMEQVNIHDGLMSIGECVIPDGFLPVGNPYTDPLPGEIPYGNSLSLFSSTKNAVIHYTLDGSEPTLESEFYKGPFVLNRNTTVKAVAVDANGFSSDTVSFTFSLKLSNPSFSPEQGVFIEPQTLHIIHPVAGAKLYYAFNGDDPHSHGTVYTEPILISVPCDITAIAVLDGVESSELIHGQYLFHAQEPKATPDVSGPHPSPLKVQLDSDTEGATILYTLDESDPYPNGTVYTESGITLTETTTIRAIAVKDDFLPSIENAWEFVVLQVSEKPVSTHETAVYGEPQLVELSGTNIRFTRNGSDPLATGHPYIEPILVSENTRIRAVSMSEGHLPSEELDITIKIQAAVPTASPQPGTHTGNQVVVLQSGTSEARIRYTTDGTTPTPTSMVFNPAEPIILRDDAVIKAFSEKDNMEPSAIVNMEYTILGGTAGVAVIPPTAIDFDLMLSPELHEPPIIAHSEGMVFAASPDLSPNATFRWYFDGLPARSNDGVLIPQGDVLRFGNYDTSITLHPGSHTIVAKVDKDGLTYSRQLIINVSKMLRQYTVKFDPGEGSMNPAEVFRNVVTTRPYGTLPVPELMNHEFLGWHTKPDGLGTLVTEETLVEVSSDVTLFAYYKPVTVRVLFDAQAGTILQESHKDLEYGMLYGDLPAVERTGYSFGGWYTEPEGKGQHIDASSPLVSLDEHTLYAKWIAPVTVNFVVADGGTLSFTQKSVLVGQKYGELPEGTKEGHALSGWWLSSNHQGTQISSNSLVETANNHTLYAKWSPFFYAVKFNPEGGSVSTTSTTVTYGTKYGNLPVPTRDGHTFDGWWTTPSSGGTRITPDTIFLTAGMQELYARWTPQQYKINFEAGDYNTLSENDRYITHGNTYGTLPTATRAGYLFQGWYSDEALTRQVSANDQMIVNDDHVLYAKWRTLLKPERLSYEGVPYVVGREVLQPEQSVYHVQTQDGHAISDTTDAYETLVRAKTIVDDPHFEYNVFVGQAEADVLGMKQEMEMAVNWSNVAFGVTYARNFFVRVLGDLVFIGPNPAKLTASTLNGFMDDFIADLQNPREFLRNWALGQLKAAMDSCDDFVNVSQSIRYWREHPNTMMASEDIVQAHWDYVYIVSTKTPIQNFIYELQHESLLEQFESIFNQVKNRLISEVESKLLEALDASYLGDMKKAYELVSNAVAHSYGIYYDTIDEFTACVNTINYNRVGYNLSVGNWLPVDKKAKVSVNFNIGYGDNPVIATTIIEEGGTYRYSPISTPPEPREGYTFEGWYTNPNGQGTQINADTVLSLMVDHIVYAYWASNEIDVALDFGISENPVSETHRLSRGQPYGGILSMTNITRPGYEFIGWYTEKDGNGQQITEDTTVTIIGNHTLYAYWVGNMLEVSFDIGYGTNPVIRVVSLKKGEAYGNLPDFYEICAYATCRPGYKFMGWYTGRDGSGQQITDISVVSLAENHTIYARWDIIYYIGPAGGYVFHDKGSYSEGWRYLEAAPGDWTAESLRFGYYRTGEGESNKVVGTEPGIGRGKDNTKALIEAMGTNAYVFSDSSYTTERYAAKFCADLVITKDGVLS